MQEEKNHKTKLTEGWDIHIAENFEQIEEIRELWENMQSKESSLAINADIDRYISVISSSENIQPYIILFNYDGCCRAILIGHIEKSPIKLAIGYKTLFRPKLKCLSIVYGGILGVDTTDVCTLVIRKIMDILTREKIDAVCINYLDMDSDFYRLARKTPNLLCRTYFPKIELHWSMTIPENTDLLFQKLVPKTRNTIKRKIRKLEKEFADQVKVVTYRDKDRLEEAIRNAHEISKNTYHTGIDSGFVNDTRTRKILATAAKHNWLHMSILYIKGEPCAFQSGLRYGKTYFLEQLGFHPHWKKWNVGTYLFFKVLEDLCEDCTINELNFGFGDAQYKQSYGDKSWNEASVYIFTPRLYPVIINILKTSVGFLNLILEYLLNKCGLKNRIKRLWRNRLEKKPMKNDN